MVRIEGEKQLNVRKLGAQEEERESLGDRFAKN